MKALIDAFVSMPRMGEILNIWPGKTGEIEITGVEGTQKILCVAALARESCRKAVVVTHSLDQAERFAEGLSSLLPEENIYLYPESELWPHEPVMEIAPGAMRAKILNSLPKQQSFILILTVGALARKVLPPAAGNSRLFKLKVGDAPNREQLFNTFVRYGFTRVEMIEGAGQFSSRGDIVDIFLPTDEEPVRLEFFGDEIETIRNFELDSQRSVGNLREIIVYPLREYRWKDEDIPEAVGKIEKSLKEQVRHLIEINAENAAKRLEERISYGIEQLKQGYFPGSEQFLPFMSPLAGLWSYFPGAALIWDEPSRCREISELQEKERMEFAVEQLENGLMLPDELEFWQGLDEIRDRTRGFPQIYLTSLGRKTEGFVPEKIFPFQFAAPPLFHGKMEVFIAEMLRLKKEGYKIAVLLSTAERTERMGKFFTEEGFAVRMTEEEWQEDDSILLGTVLLGGGILLKSQKLLFLTDQEIFGQAKRKKWTRRTRDGKAIKALADLAVGDYVVHINHGIGQYLGIKTMEIAGIHQDYLEIKYAGDSDRLFVPVEQIGALQKYLGSENGPPKLSKLGGNDWQRLKNKVRESVKEMAVSLIKLYAERKAVLGHAYAPDTVWQKEFEESFPYEETPDQLKAVQEIKMDMEKSVPMDRLLCGDVGYGKTEVAMRAAFKAVMEQKQVAFLVPTTILAQQHYQTFCQRFEKFPVTIGILSRFQTQRQQLETINSLAAGKVDIVIGTHRLLSPDIRFKDLGLLIVDEEQRFGVMHKEKLKIYKKNTEVLTLTATPIPRTLHMSMIGVRDISTIETPPENRYPIRTFVEEFSEPLIIEAIHRELSRKGQVYFVYNRVETIEQMAAYLKRLLPEVNFGIAHGQMAEDRLEQEMIDFYQKKIDCLICTTIIETGMDIPNVNTLIVYDADQFGLSQLYQLRGRVGRSNRVAYAYFTFRKDKSITEVAEKRLKTIKEFTALGSGLKIALRDLEIRGAGNILGPEQHGFIANVGFELYCQMLEEAITEEKFGRKVQEVPDVNIDLKIDAYIPQRYIRDERQRVEIYRKLAAVQNMQELQEIADELIDRFGDAPREVQNLLSIASIRILARPIGVAMITSDKYNLTVKLFKGLIVDQNKIQGLIKRYSPDLTVHFGKTVVIRLHKYQRSDEELLPKIINILGNMELALQAS